MQTTPVPGLFHQLSELLQPRPQPNPAADRNGALPPRKMVTGQGAVHGSSAQRQPAPTGTRLPGRATAQAALPAEPDRNLPRGSFLNIVV